MMDEKILRLPKVVNKTGLPKTAIYNGMTNGTFPKSIQLSRRSIGWLETEINQWIEQRIKHSRTIKEDV